MNSVTLSGSVATSVELREVAEERRVASFLLAVERPAAAGGRADYIRVAAWNRQADLCHRRLAKGARVGIEGRLRSRFWRDADGRRRSSLEVVANAVEVLAGAGEPA